MNISGLLPESSVLTDLLHLLARHQITLSFLCLDTSLETHPSFCLAKKDCSVGVKIIDDLLRPLGIPYEIIHSVGALTLFPHKSRLEVIAQALLILVKYEFPVYSLGSSISALTINMDYGFLDQAAEFLRTVFLLPENHTPFRQHLPESIVKKEKGTCQKRPFVETAASYWEPVIRIYGTSIQTELVMVTLGFPEEKLLSVAGQFENIDEGLGRFELILMQRLANQAMQVSLLYGVDMEPLYSASFADIADNNALSLVVRSPVELIYFHGPHFQDRYGVADATLSTLKKQQVELLAAGCTGTSVYLVVPEGNARNAAEFLEKEFLVPH